jgi:hypothetical protein
VLELREISDVLCGLAIRETGQGSARFLRVSDVSDIKAGHTPSFGVGEAPAVGRALVIEHGDLIIAGRGAATDVLVATDGVVGAFVSLDLYLVRPDRARVSPDYLAAFLMLPETQAQFSLKKQGTSLARLPKEALERMSIPFPSLEVQRQIAGLAACVDEEIRLLRQLTDVKTVFGREVVARAIGDATRRNQ